MSYFPRTPFFPQKTLDTGALAGDRRRYADAFYASPGSGGDAVSCALEALDRVSPTLMEVRKERLKRQRKTSMLFHGARMRTGMTAAADIENGRKRSGSIG